MMARTFICQDCGDSFVQLGSMERLICSVCWTKAHIKED